MTIVLKTSNLLHEGCCSGWDAGKERFAKRDLICIALGNRNIICYAYFDGGCKTYVESNETTVGIIFHFLN
jgi:hypothetical protein